MLGIKHKTHCEDRINLIQKQTDMKIFLKNLARECVHKRNRWQYKQRKPWNPLFWKRRVQCPRSLHHRTHKRNYDDEHTCIKVMKPLVSRAFTGLMWCTRSNLGLVLTDAVPLHALIEESRHKTCRSPG